MRQRSITLFLLVCAMIISGCGEDAGDQTTSDARSDVTAAMDASSDVTTAPDVAEDAEGDAAPDAEGPEQLELPPEPWDITAPGPYNPGYTTLRISYTAEGPAGGERELRIALWYPTLDAEGAGSRYMNIFNRNEALRDATPAPAPAEGYPILLFSHGSSSFAEQSFYMTEFFASHGWLVAAPDHTGNTIANLEEPIPPDAVYLRPQDISATLDLLYDMPEGHALEGRASDRVAVAGHSFGGYTSIALAGASYQIDALLAGCEQGEVDERVCNAATDEVIATLRDGWRDPRILASIPQNPGAVLLFDVGMADIDIPVLLMTGDLDATTPEQNDGAPAWAHLNGADDLRLRYTTGGHFTLSDACELLPFIGDGDGCGEGFIEFAEAAQVSNAYSMAFARRHLLGDTSQDAFLDGPMTLSDEVLIERK